MLNWARSRSDDADALLHGTRISVDDLRESDIPITAEQEIVVIRNMIATFGRSMSLGAQVGREFHLSSYGRLGYLLMTCMSVDEMTDAAFRYAALGYAFTSRATEVDPAGGLTVVFDVDGVPPDIAEFALGRDLGATVQAQRELFPSVPGTFLRGIELAYSPTGDEDAIRAALAPVPVSFGHSQTRLRFTDDCLSEAPPLANRHTSRAMAGDCDRARLGVLRSVGVAKLVRDHLRAAAMVDVAFDSCARALKFSPRTLRRRLADEGTSFSEVLDEVRRDIAWDLIQSGASRQTLRRRPGYQEESSVTRALRRWGLSH